MVGHGIVRTDWLNDAISSRTAVNIALSGAFTVEPL
ncbi:hypothetical protein EDD34_0669 [Myceligenerans xiligouense]|uniref:Uncharacterized protein n=1 Tax=Myceligenerans xiligouense TaxID=253184 RepID=A0A3N4Z4G6_9MICO|nr:hypothetical protein EDD34_0669 [Myceligenerans xiligouense]